MAFGNVGRVWDPKSFQEFVATQDLSWAQGVTIHHTSTPNHDQRPRGFTIQHIRNIQDYYEREKGWSSGPHLFTDDDQIFGMSSLERRGVHAKSFNATHIGLEVLGDYDAVDPQLDPRGKDCWGIAVQTTAILLTAMGKTSGATNFHRDDPRTGKTCPGKKFNKEAFVNAVSRERDVLLDDREDDPISPALDLAVIRKVIEALEWQLKKLKRQLT